jgi:hypothetical protein
VRIVRTPNTQGARELIVLAQCQGKSAAVVDALFRAYLDEAKEIGAATVLADIAARHEVSGWPGQARAPEAAALEEEMCRRSPSPKRSAKPSNKWGQINFSAEQISAYGATYRFFRKC